MIHDWIVRGGPWMWPIVALSILGLMLIFERLFFWLKFSLVSNPRRRQAAIERREESPGRDPVAKIALSTDPSHAKYLASRLLAESRRGVGALELIASLSTSLGLFGTVIGVSMSFDAIHAGESGEVVRGLGVALFTTVLGLIVHLYCAVFSVFFNHLGDRLESDVERALTPAPPERRAA